MGHYGVGHLCMHVVCASGCMLTVVLGVHVDHAPHPTTHIPPYPITHLPPPPPLFPNNTQIKETEAPVPRGTRLTLHLKEDAYEYADDKRLQGLLKQYSEFISFPISLYTSKQERKEVVDEAATQEKQKEADEKVWFGLGMVDCG